MGRSPISAGSKEATLDDVVAAVPDGATVAVGGFGLYNAPMALVRALVRAGRRDLTLVATPGSIAPDLLIGTGRVATVYCVHIDFGPLGSAPSFRRAVESGALNVLDFDMIGLVAGLRAAAMSLPWFPIPDLGSDLPRVNADWYRPLAADVGPAPGAARLLAVPPLAPDVVLLHAQQADYGGNCQYLGATFLDVLLAQAGKKVFVSVDRMIDYDALRRAPERTRLPEFLVDGVVHAPYGAHPTGSHGAYEWDESHLGYYLEAARAPGGLEHYVKMFVTTPVTPDAYVDAVGRQALRDLHR